MNKRVKKIITMALASSMIMGSIVSANTITVSFKRVDSNEYTYLDSVKKGSTTDYASAKIKKFYKANGNPTSDYDELYVRCGSDGSQAGRVLCKTGTAKKLTLKGTYNKKGTSLKFYGMGHDPALDCYVDAELNADVS